MNFVKLASVNLQKSSDQKILKANLELCRTIIEAITVDLLILGPLQNYEHIFLDLKFHLRIWCSWL